MNGYAHCKDDALRRLSRAESQVRGITKMAEPDQYCIAVMAQGSAATKALGSVALVLLGEHSNHYAAEAVAEGRPVAGGKIREANAAIACLAGF
ncbi:metal-sensitive transcriptional regulator [Homoserinimonas sp. OAct 916]|uniref:metal-sensitive transcriptional regulator n=1 Tax=Homoserinimonas sp. OAct 916 TaxID=2211450 RepID=UPI000DBE9B9F|nr:metal-sensitive transcriptional regulator [Homoserinimonas sp. OAct 916]